MHIRHRKVKAEKSKNLNRNWDKNKSGNKMRKKKTSEERMYEHTFLTISCLLLLFDCIRCKLSLKRIAKSFLPFPAPPCVCVCVRVCTYVCVFN